MKGIVEALKTNEDLRITNFKKWMVFNSTTNEWEVYEERNGEGVMIENTRDEGLAVNCLLSD